MKKDLDKIIEVLLFTYGDPITLNKLSKVAGASTPKVKDSLRKLKKRLKKESGLVIIEENNRFQLVTKKEYASLIEKIFKAEQREELTRATLEVLAIIAYEGPVARSEIEEIRGVNSSFIIRKLLIRGLISKKEEKAPKYQITLSALRELGLEKREDLPNWNQIKREIGRVKEILKN